MKLFPVSSVRWTKALAAASHTPLWGISRLESDILINPARWVKRPPGQPRHGVGDALRGTEADYDVAHGS